MAPAMRLAVSRTCSMRKSRSPSLRDHQRGHVDRRERVGGVDLAVHELEGHGGARAGRFPHVRREPRDQPLVGLVSRRAPARDLVPRELEAAPRLLRAREVRGRVLLVLGRSRGEIRDRAVEHERDRALRVGRGEQHRHRAALGDAEDDRPLRSDGVHHGAHVVHARLEVGKPVLRHPIGEADAALVEQDQPRERREAFEEPGEAGGVPHRLDVRDPPHHEDHVDGSVAHHLIGDVDPVGGLRVAGLGVGHVRILAVAGRGGNRLSGPCTLFVRSAGNRPRTPPG